jgi:hypothetical protein
MRKMQIKKNTTGKKIIIWVIVAGMIVAGVILWRKNNPSGSEKAETKKDEIVSAGDERVAEGINIRVFSPNVNSSITSPLKITGEVKGWFFEGIFPVKLLDEKGKVLATGKAQATSDWQDDAYVPFESELKFSAGESKQGNLIFEKSNPSGMPENAGSFSFAVLLSK